MRFHRTVVLYLVAQLAIFSVVSFAAPLPALAGTITCSGTPTSCANLDGSIGLAAFGSAYTQDFNSLASTGTPSTSSPLPAGWGLNEVGSSTRVDGLYSAGTGSSTTGDIYSFGTSGDRALGTLFSGSIAPSFGASFTNNTGGTITQLAIAYTAEEWRLGTTGRAIPDRLDFQYSTTATTLNNGIWIDVDALDATEPITVGTAGALDGNVAVNRRAISGTISGLNIASGATFWIRWTDFDASSSDDGLAVDDFSLTPSGTTQSAMTVSKSGSGTGLVTSSPAGITCGTSCSTASAPFDSGTLVTLTETPDSGATFTGWSANCAPTTATQCTVTVSGATSVTATFSAPVTLTVSIAGSGSGTVTGGGINCPGTCSATFSSGRAVTLTATSTSDIGWAGCATSTATTCTVTMDASKTVTVTFTAVVAIHDIQGSGSQSPYAGMIVVTTGIVTGLKLGSSGGFYVQTPDAQVDSDPATSEGIFAFTGSSLPAGAVVGNSVKLVGPVNEFIPTQDVNSPPVTELNHPTLTVLSTSNPLPAAITLTAADTSPSGFIEQLERYEGMRVHVDSLTVSGPTAGKVDETTATSTSTGLFYGVITGIARPFREPGIEVPDPLPTGAPTTIPRFDANPERLRVDSAEGRTPIEVTSGATVTNLTGPLDYTFRTYTIVLDPTNPVGVSGNAVATPVRLAAPWEFTVASFNMERFFDTVNDPSKDDAVLTPAAFELRLTKMSLAIRAVLHSPDIIGVEEMENLANLQAIAARVNADTVAAAGTDPHYVAYLIEGNDIGGIDVGFLVKSSRVDALDVTQYGKDATYTDPNNNQQALLNDRPSLLLHARVNSATDDPFLVTVIVNHLRSLSSVDDPVDGNRVRAKRQAQAEWLATFIQTLQAADPNERIVSVGDYNAFEFNDGYVDVMGTIIGAPTPPDQVTRSSGDLVNPNLVDLGASLPADQKYSFLFDGNAQELDHVLITSNLTSFSSGLQIARNDADFPESFRGDATRPERISDHDPAVAYFTIPDTTPPSITAPAAQTAEATSPFGATVVRGSCLASDARGTVTVTYDRPQLDTYPLGTTTLHCTATDAAGNTASATFSITVQDTTPPSIAADSDVTAEATSAAGAVVSYSPCTATDLASTPTIAYSQASGTQFPLGTTTVTCTATDGAGLTASTFFEITVQDTTPPTITGSASPAPNGAGWNNTAVTVHFVCTDLLLLSCEADHTLTTDGAGQSVTGTATDTSGNAATATVGGINIDRTAPDVHYTGNAGTYTVDQTVHITCSASDGLSGVATNTCADINGAASSFTLGTNTFHATATDVAGNFTTVSTSFTVTVTYDSLCALTRALSNNPSVAAALCQKLANASAAATRGDLTAAGNIAAAYQNEVDAQSGKAFTAAAAALLRSLAGAF